MKHSAKQLIAGLVASASAFLAIPATVSFAGGGGGGGVAGPCGTLSGVTASSVTVSGSTSSALQVRGSVKNCSIYLQDYYVVIDEPTQTTTSCKASASLFNALLLSSGSTKSFSMSTNTGATNTSGCPGTHTLRVALRSRADGRVLSTVTTTYSVVAK